MSDSENMHAPLPKVSRLRKTGLCGVMAAGATAILAAAPLQTANAAIVYSGLLTSNNTTNTFAAGAPTVFLDLNNDGTNDVEIMPIASAKNFAGQFYFAPLNVGKNATSNLSSIFVTDAASGASVLALDSVIDANQSYVTDSQDPLLNDGSGVDFDGYVGLAFDPGNNDSTQMDYAWIHLQETYARISDGVLFLTVVDYAYEDGHDTANGTILAGQTADAALPEPASLSALGLGGLALLARRRRRSAKPDSL